MNSEYVLLITLLLCVFGLLWDYVAFGMIWNILDGLHIRLVCYKDRVKWRFGDYKNKLYLWYMGKRYSKTHVWLYVEKRSNRKEKNGSIKRTINENKFLYYLSDYTSYNTLDDQEIKGDYLTNQYVLTETVKYGRWIEAQWLRLRQASKDKLEMYDKYGYRIPHDSIKRILVPKSYISNNIKV